MAVMPKLVLVALLNTAAVDAVREESACLRIGSQVEDV